MVGCSDGHLPVRKYLHDKYSNVERFRGVLGPIEPSGLGEAEMERGWLYGWMFSGAGKTITGNRSSGK